MKYKTYAEVHNDFLCKELHKIAGRDKTYDLFQDLDLFRDEFEKLASIF